VFCSLSAEGANGSQATKPAGVAAIQSVPRKASDTSVRLFLCGDVMTGRAIDQIMPYPGDPKLYEPVVRSAKEYLALAEKASGPIPRSVSPSYVWGDALAELDRARPDARIVNLETAVTIAGDPWPDKPVHYRMNPANVSCLSVARIDCCTLANNHILDWGYTGLKETIARLHAAGIRTAGAGASLAESRAPSVIQLATGRRVIVFAYGSASAGIPASWAARARQAGVSTIDEEDPAAVGEVASAIRSVKRPGDLAVVSIHWGSNWGYDVPDAQRSVAHRLIDEAGVDVVYGHSSHHPRPIEVHSGKLILYGCGDFLNDYEGIGHHSAYRPELGLMYLPDLDAESGRLERLMLVPVRLRKFSINRATAAEADWLRDMLEREGSAFGTSFALTREGCLDLVNL
jgi:poly-gamma-glutamate synthesis protein (capsule biosynthesis protein)